MIKKEKIKSFSDNVHKLNKKTKANWIIVNPKIGLEIMKLYQKSKRKEKIERIISSQK
jgi:predicted CopG family antitoxin